VPIKQMVLKTPSPESHCAGIKAGDKQPALQSVHGDKAIPDVRTGERYDFAGTQPWLYSDFMISSIWPIS
jgi:hypothetical protein